MYEGYLEFGGGEVLNSARALAYSQTAPCPVTWLQCPPCDGIRDVLGDDPYTYETIELAPWYDAEDEVTHRFLGAHAISVEGIPDSTREASVAENMLDGGVVGRVRHATRRMRYRALLTAQGEDALEAGFSWLSSALTPGSCGSHGDGCGAADARFFTACPPERESITMPETFWNDPVTNLATNPSMETAGAAVAVRTNLFTNPSFEQATAATVEVRRNLSLNPRLGVDATGWGATGTWAVPGARTAVADLSGFAWALQASTPAPVAGQNIRYQLALTAGLKYRVGFWAKQTSGGAGVARVASDGVMNTPIGLDLPLPNDGLWHWYSGIVTPVASALHYFGARFSTGNTNLTGAVTGLLVEQVDGTAPTSTEFFDGSTLPAGDFTHAWTGTADASASVQYGTAVPAVTGFGSLRIQSTEWAKSGAKSARLIPLSNQSCLQFPTGFHVTTLLPGKTYTAMATLRMTAVQSGSIQGAARTIEAQTKVAGVYSAQRSAPAPNLPGVYPLRVTFTVPADATEAFVRLVGGASVGDTWWDDFLIVEGTYTGPYFDGSTPPKVRRNMVPNPNFGTGVTTGWAKYWSPSWSVSTVNPMSGGNGKSLLVGKGTDTHTAQGAYFSSKGWFSEGDTLHAIVRVRGEVGIIMDIGFRVNSGGASGGPLNVVGDGQWHEYEYTMVANAGHVTNGVGISINVDNSNTWPESSPMFQIDSALIANETTGTYFDADFPIAPYAGGWDGTVGNSPSYLTDPDFTYAWTGTANASTSQQKALGVAGVGETYLAQPIQSTQWASNRAHSMRIIPTGSPTEPYSYTSFAFAGLEAGRTYTAIAKIRLTAAQVGPMDARARKIVAMSPGMTTVESSAAPNVAGVTELRITFTLAADPTAVVYLYNGASAGGGDVWYDDFALVAGDYGGTYFDGSFPDSPPEDHEVVGKTVAEYGWTGTADASTSTYRTGSVVAVPDPVEYERIINTLTRYLHTVTCVSGPTVEQKLHRGETWGYVVEFVLVAAVPWMFSVTRPVILTPTTPVVVQDVPFNLVPYPSAELESGTVVAARNLSANPSVEADASGWVATAGTATGSDVTPYRSSARVTVAGGDVAADGGASFRHRVLGDGSTAAAGTTNLYSYQDVAVSGQPAGTRFSFSVWAAALIIAGAAGSAINQLNAKVEWRDASSVLRSDPLGTALTTEYGGRLFTGKSLLPPAGAITARVTVTANVNWTSAVGASNSDIRVYADALTVSVP